MRYTRTAQGLLNAQYRSVLKKCLMINLGLFALGANVAGAEDFILKAEDLSTSKNITWKEISAAEYKSDNPNMLKVSFPPTKRNILNIPILSLRAARFMTLAKKVKTAP